MAEPKRPCRHPLKSDAWIMFMIGPRLEPIVYCWACGSLKRERDSWQHTTREERVRELWAKARKRKGGKRG